MTDKTFNITFRHTLGYLNYFMLFENFWYQFSRDMNYDDLPQRFMIDIYNEIGNNSDKVVEIRITVTDDNFVPVSNFIKSNQKFLMAFYQFDVDIEDELPKGQEALEYFLKPFDMEDYKYVFGFGDEWYDEYYYERVSRLLLEYEHDKIRGSLSNSVGEGL